MVGTAKHFFTFDHLGSIRESVNSTGALESRFDYAPFGGATTVLGSFLPDFSFQGMQILRLGSLTPFNLTWGRIYNPWLGTWLSRDPIGIFGGINLYAYVANRPISYKDSLGLQATMIPGYPTNPFTGEPFPGNPNYQGPEPWPYIAPWEINDYAEHRRRCSGDDSGHHPDAVREAGRSSGYPLGPLYYPVGGYAALVAAAMATISEMIFPSPDWLRDMEANKQGIKDFLSKGPDEPDDPCCR